MENNIVILSDCGIHPPPLEGGARGGVRGLSKTTFEHDWAQASYPPPNLPLKGGGVMQMRRSFCMTD